MKINIRIHRIVLILLFVRCEKGNINLKPVSYAEFEQFVNETKYITDAEKYGWSIVQIDVFNYKTVKNAHWKKPDGVHLISSKKTSRHTSKL